jgi:hypothetical protein
MSTAARFAVALGMGVAGIASHAGAAATPARMQVTADEFTLVLSRHTLPAGPAIVQLVNRGEDDHDLALRRAGGVIRRIETVTPGRVDELETTLRPGRYILWCTLAGHRARGMGASLLVRATERASRR